MYHVGIVYNDRDDHNQSDNYMTSEKGNLNEIADANEVKQALEEKGHRVSLIKMSKNILTDISKDKSIDCLLNLCCGITKSKEQANIISLFELTGIPFVGSSAFVQEIGLNKSFTKHIFDAYDIPNAKFQVFTSENQKLNNNLEFPLMVKPESESSSVGITKDSIVRDKDELKKRIKYVLDNFNQNALVEEFLPGREFTVSVIGTDEPKVLPVLEIIFIDDKDDQIQSRKIKEENKIKRVAPADLPEDVTRKIKENALKVYKIFGCSSYIRIDIKMDKDDNPDFIELNTLPGLFKEKSDVPFIADKYGMNYGDLLDFLVKDAVKNFKE